MKAQQHPLPCRACGQPRDRRTPAVCSECERRQKKHQAGLGLSRRYNRWAEILTVPVRF